MDSAAVGLAARRPMAGGEDSHGSANSSGVAEIYAVA